MAGIHKSSNHEDIAYGDVLCGNHLINNIKLKTKKIKVQAKNPMSHGILHFFFFYKPKRTKVV